MNAVIEWFRHRPESDRTRAVVRIDRASRGSVPFSPLLLGKFCEHLGSNIQQGMDAQLLRNPTFAAWRFSAGEKNPDGGISAEHDLVAIAAHMKNRAEQSGWPDGARLFDAWRGGGAYPWFSCGAVASVRCSPDVGPFGHRAQRVEIAASGAPAGLAQWTYLPLHRTRRYVYRVVARAMKPVELTLALDGDGGAAGAAVSLSVGTEWITLTGHLELPESAPAGALYTLSLTVPGSAHFVLDRVLLYPSDHVNGADPEVIRYLKDSRLPLLRWPGGNFVSGYRWRDGVGSMDARPTRPNPAWDGLEPNLFGTAEFIAFCRAVGCAPMICVNAGDGTPEEAAEWIEYCNGSADTPMGALRSQHGYPEPFGVHYWEIGNELYGSWQVHWTTADGYFDRHRRFAAALRNADPSIRLLATGNAMALEDRWNVRLIEEGPEPDLCLTDHLLTGGPVDARTDPEELLGAFLGLAGKLGADYRALHARMRAAGVSRGRLAVTELQLFARFRGEEIPGAKLSRATMPSPDTVSEALYFATILFELARLDGFCEMLTHSATVNHGGGLRKQRERVWANPVHYVHTLCAELNGGTPVALEVGCDTYSTTHNFGHIPPLTQVPVLDAFAVEQTGGTLVACLVHRGVGRGPLEVTLHVPGFAAGRVEGLELHGAAMHDRNTREVSDRIVPRELTVTRDGEALRITLPPFGFARLILRPS